MPYSAPALGVGLRLRSRRVRADRSHSSTVRLALIAALLAALAGFFGATVGDDTQPWAWFGQGPGPATGSVIRSPGDAVSSSTADAGAASSSAPPRAVAPPRS